MIASRSSSHGGVIVNSAATVVRPHFLRAAIAMRESGQEMKGAKVAKVIASIIIAGILLMIGYALLPWMIHG